MVRNGHNVFFNMVRNGHVSICICHDMVRNGHIIYRSAYGTKWS